VIGDREHASQATDTTGEADLGLVDAMVRLNPPSGCDIAVWVERHDKVVAVRYTNDVVREIYCDTVTGTLVRYATEVGTLISQGYTVVNL
jgi:hypothetical protein